MQQHELNALLNEGVLPDEGVQRDVLRDAARIIARRRRYGSPFSPEERKLLETLHRMGAIRIKS